MPRLLSSASRRALALLLAIVTSAELFGQSDGVNAAPVNIVPGSQSVAEDTARIFSTGNGNLVSVSDVDDADNGIIGDESMRITLTVTQGMLTLGSTAGLSFTSGANGTATMTFTGTIANLNNALSGLGFLPTLNFTGAATLTITTNDLGNFGTGSALSDTDTVTITVTGVNDAPANTVPGSQSVAEDTAGIFSTGNGNLMSVSDVDDANNGISGDESMRITLSVTQGTLTLGSTAGLSFTSGANGTAAMTFTGTIANLNNALSGLGFLPTLNFTGAATLTITTNDLGNFGTGSALSDTDTVTITVTGVNDAPANTVPGSQSVAEDTAGIFSTGTGNLMSVSDVDDANNGISGDESMRITLSVTQGTLTLGSTAGLSVTSGANGTATMTFTGAIANLNNALSGLGFLPTLNFTGAVTLTITTNDLGNFGTGSALSDTDTVTITVTGVNDAPANTVPGSQSVAEDTAGIFSTGTGNLMSVSDVDDANNGISGDESMQVSLTVTQGTLTLGSTAGVSVTSGANGTATMTFSGAIANLNNALNGLSFAPALNVTGPATLTITTNDLGNFGTGSALSDTDTVTITVTGVNDAPANTVPGSQSVAEDTAGIFSTGTGNLMSVSDVDDANNGISGDESMQVSLTVTQGTLTLGSTAGVSVTSGANGTATMTFSGAIANLNNALNGLSFAPALNVTGPATLTITTNDLGNFGTGSALSDTDTVTVTVNGVNDAPVNTVPGPQTTKPDTARIFNVGNGNLMSVSDMDDADNGISGDESMQVSLTATHGTVTLSGTTGLGFTAGANGTATMTFTGTIANLNNALSGLGFLPTLNFTGAATLTITTNDLGNFGAGSALSDTDTVAVTVTSFTDDPLVAGTAVVRAVHITEMRSRIDSVRVRNRLGNYPWARTITPGTVTILAADIMELRTALDQAYDQIPQAHFGYARTIVSGLTIEARDITDIRAALLAIE